MNLGKLTVENVFVNVELLKVIIRKYSVEDRCLYDKDGEKFMEISIESLNEAFRLTDCLTKRLSFTELKNEYERLDISYMQWKLMLQKIEKEPLTIVDGLPFSTKLFNTYFYMT